VTTAAILSLVVIVAVLLLMMMDVASPDILMVGGVIVLTSAGVIGPNEAFAGFSNTGMLTVAALFIVASGLRETGAVTMLTSRMLGRPKTTSAALIRLVPPVIAASSFLNNTTIVATLLPAVQDWGRRINISPGQLLMPLSFATILGGTCTLIGTSTNLVVAGLVTELAPSTPGLHELGMFEITPLGFLVALAGGTCLIVLGPWLLPDRRAPVSRTDDPREYTIELLVPADSRLAGRTVEEAGLRHLPGTYLMEIVRGGEVLPAIEARQRLHAGDRLVFVGDVDAMVDLHRFPGLAAAPDQVFKLTGGREERHIVEAVVSPRNPILGLSIREGEFRKRYHSVVIAVARAGERVAGRIGDIVLCAGDVLLLEAPPGFVAEHKSRNDFYLASSVEGATPPRFERAWLATLILAAFVIVSATESMPTVTAAFYAAGAMVLTRCCTIEEARKSLDLTVLVAIGASFGLGEALQVTGLAASLAEFVVHAGADTPMLGLVVVYLVAAVLTELVTNNAAAVLTVPIAVALADQLDAQPMGYVIAVMFAASASFLTPIGYQTNMMVYNAGGYKPVDYPRLGLPLSVTAAAVTLTTIPWLWPL
jgi:di/tricarboxylate transporter